MAQKTRNYAFTWNNYTATDYDRLLWWFTTDKTVIYYVVGREVGKSGTPHLQGQVCFKNARHITALKKFSPKIHWEPTIKLDKSIEYCKKDGQFVESGTPPINPGKRNDLIEIHEEIQKGRRVEDIAVENPMLYHQYGRTLNKLEDIAMRKKFRTEMTQGFWYWGATATGKSHKALEGFTPETHYIYPNDGGWCDGYIQQEFFILNDFRGEINYNGMLQLVDKWPHWLKRRCREPIPFVSKYVIVTSSLPPWEIYHRRHDEDSIAQLLRRFIVIRFDSGTAQGWSGNTEPTTDPDTDSDVNILNAMNTQDAPTFSGITRR